MPEPAPPPAAATAGRRVAVLAAAIALAFGAWSLLLTTGLDPTARDQSHDLALAIRIREGTSLTDGNRHPLYPAILAPWAARDPRFFADARVVSALLAAASLFAVHLAAARAFSPAIGLLTMLGVLLEFRLQARRLCPEPLLAALLALAAASLSRAGTARRPLLATGIGGAWTGAAWLAKGSATLSLAAAALHALLFAGPRRAPQLIALLLGFAAVAWPLLAWNVARGRSPLFNVNSAHVMWEDAWDVELDRRSTATAADWIARHGLADGAARLAEGLRRQRGVEWVYGFGAALLAAGLLRRASRRGDGDAAAVPEDPVRRAWRAHALLTAALWLPAMAWYAPVVASRRLLFPIFPVLLPPALDALAAAARAVLPRATAAARRVAGRLPRAAPCAAAALAILAAILLSRAGNPRARPGIDASFVEAGRRLRALPPGTRVLVRPSRTYPPDWLAEGVAVYVALPASVPDPEVADWIRGACDHVLLNEGLLRHRPAALAPLARWDEARGVVLASDPPAWAGAAWSRDEAAPSRWCLVRTGP